MATLLLISLLIVFFFAFSKKAAAAGEFVLSSSELTPNGTLEQGQLLDGPECNGFNIPPSFSWSNPPEGTKSFALTVYDPDAPTGSGWWHWLVFNIPADTRSIPLNAGVSAKETLSIPTGKLPEGAVESLTDFGKPGYGGACPPVGDKPHRYVFTIHALDVESLDLSPTSMPAQVGFAMHFHRIGKAEFTCYYGR